MHIRKYWYDLNGVDMMNKKNVYFLVIVIACFMVIPNTFTGVTKGETIDLGLSEYLTEEDPLALGPPFGETIVEYPSTIKVGCVFWENRTNFPTYTAHFHHWDLDYEIMDYNCFSVVGDGGGIGVPNPYYFNLTLTYEIYPGETTHAMKLECYSSNQDYNENQDWNWTLTFVDT